MILILAIVAPSMSIAENLLCTALIGFDYAQDTGLKKAIIEEEEKIYVSINKEVLAINAGNSYASIYKLNNSYSSGIVGLINRKFINIEDYATDIVVIKGKECSYGDTETRSMTWTTTFADAVFASVLSCKCD